MWELGRQCGNVSAEIAVCCHCCRVVSSWKVGAYEKGGGRAWWGDEERGEASAESRRSRRYIFDVNRPGRGRVVGYEAAEGVVEGVTSLILGKRASGRSSGILGR